MVNGNAGKGDSCRPFNKKQWDKNWLRIFGKPCSLCNGVEGNKCSKCFSMGFIEREKKC